MSRGFGLLRVVSQGLSRPFLKTFVAITPDPTDRPLVPEDDNFSKNKKSCMFEFKKNANKFQTYIFDSHE